MDIDSITSRQEKAIVSFLKVYAANRAKTARNGFSFLPKPTTLAFMATELDEIPGKKAAYHRMESALYILAENQHCPPSLAELARHCGLSEFHFQKMFKRWVGISPKRFSQYLSKEYIKTLLDEGIKPLDAGYQAGLSGPARLHDLFIHTEAISPAQYKARGQGMLIHYGFHESPFGNYLLAVTDKGICHLDFTDSSQQQTLFGLSEQWPCSDLHRNESMTEPVHQRLFGKMSEQPEQISVLLKGTNFQIQVWQALLRIPYGQLCSYETLAQLAGRPAATRACASAIARNSIAWLIPCHRVIKKIGESGQYRWGAERKKIILGFEAATHDKNNTLPDA